MRVLLDTCVISELKKPDGNQRVKDAISNMASENLFMSVITIGEITKGISLLKESKRKRNLNLWLENLENDYKDNIVFINTETARIWGELTAKAQRSGKVLPNSDGLIAASALQHGLHLITRNIKDFESTGAMLINPWKNLSLN